MQSIISFFAFLSYCLCITCTNHKAPPIPPTLADIQVQKSSRNQQLLKQAKTMVQNGFLVLRGGKDFSSRLVKELNKENQTYSHAGIAIEKNGQLRVYHIMPDHANNNDKVRIESIDSFWAPDDNAAIGIARYKIDSQQTQRLLTHLQGLYNRQVRFDMAFDLKTDNTMYCSEMIAKALSKATQNRVCIQPDTLNDKSKYKLIEMYYHKPRNYFANTAILPIDRLFLNPYCLFLKHYHYEE